MPRRVALFCLVTFLASGGLVALQERTPVSVDLIQLVQFAPAIGVLALLVVFRGSIHLRAALSPVRQVGGSCLVAVVAVLLATSLAIGVAALAGREWHHVWTGDLAFPLWAMVITLTVGSIGEELGWRAWLQPHLETRFSVLTSSVLVGLVFGFWHVGGWASGPAYMLVFVVMAVAMSIVLGEIIRHARGGNLAVATVLHTAANLGMLVVLDEESGSLVAVVALASGWAVTAAVALVVGNRLGPGAATPPPRDAVTPRAGRPRPAPPARASAPAGGTAARGDRRPTPQR